MMLKHKTLTAALQRFSNGLRIFGRRPLSVLSNPFVGLASVVAMFGSLLTVMLEPAEPWVLALVAIVFVYGVWDELNKSYIYHHEIIPLPVVINISNPANNRSILNQLFHIIEGDRQFRNHRHNLSQYLSIEESDLIFDYQADIYNQDRLKDFLKISHYRLNQLKIKHPRNTILYLVYVGPASVAILIGAMLGNESIKIFQYNKSENGYYEALYIRDRAFKETIQHLKVLSHKRSPKTHIHHPRVTVAIDLASHRIKLKDPSIQNYGDIIYLYSQFNKGTIGADEDWLRYCQEIYSVLNGAQQNYRQEIRLVYSMPVALALGLGCALQGYWNILLTNYDRATSTYLDLIKMNELRYLF